ncbi:hypothetical protein CANARDRAFT_22373 [[Candida] arabinofermentans NRRL YB-2248]|uniref:Mitochondrial outer membrane transport complex Sam37/metaxin N-terminal domain-containing protein n=1 Tax=[Candida] arabinofermentans NRRL YB-2248 TaxID=983967 RepID=A0A1E4T3Z3_9ASCO|nr:hypothetical protein CANARDRAFT_22373 [[Candida] arabinofermentans NRRL YB-2248]
MVSIVPQTFKDTLAKFPLKTYPPEAVEIPELKNAFVHRQFKFRASSTSKDKTSSEFSKFNLGVYNITPLSYDANVAASLDPVCFYAMLLLASKTKSKLPLLSGSDLSTEQSLGSVSLLSYHSSIEGELPILVEDEQNKKLKKITRKIRSTATIDKFSLSSVENPKEIMFTKLLDTRVYDFFMSCVFESFPDDLKLRLYSLNKNDSSPSVDESLTVFDRLTLPSILAYATRRYNFNVRNPSIAYKYLQLVPVRPHYLAEAIKSEIARCSEEGLETLRSFASYLDAAKTPYFFGNEPSVFDFKLAAMIHCIVNIEKCDAFTYVSSNAPSLVEHSERVIRLVI